MWMNSTPAASAANQTQDLYQAGITELKRYLPGLYRLIGRFCTGRHAMNTSRQVINRIVAILMASAAIVLIPLFVKKIGFMTLLWIVCFAAYVILRAITFVPLMFGWWLTR
jgi:hypothetical protein